MSEASMAVSYSKYLQDIYIVDLAGKDDKDYDSSNQYFLSYEDFKDYYMLKLVGKDNFIDKLVNNIQFDTTIEETN
jgi:hypothetical protein